LLDNNIEIHLISRHQGFFLSQPRIGLLKIVQGFDQGTPAEFSAKKLSERPTVVRTSGMKMHGTHPALLRVSQLARTQWQATLRSDNGSYLFLQLEEPVNIVKCSRMKILKKKSCVSIVAILKFLGVMKANIGKQILRLKSL
jgi:hypothetical protein